jgi:sugar phosphate isomerase/epimerase
MGMPWGYHPDNHQPETLKKVIRVFQDLVITAEANDSFVAVEGAFNHVAYNPEKIRILLDQINHPRLKVIVDLFNFLHPGNVDQQLAILDECLGLFPEQILIFHLKDFVVDQGRLRQVGLGQGQMKYPDVIARIKRITPNAFLIFEGVTGDDIQPSVAYINQLLSKE